MNKELKLIDYTAVKEAKQVMRDRFAIMVKYFIEDTENYLLEIEKGLENDDIQAILLPAHTIKSAARQMGAQRVSSVAKTLEFLCRDAIASSGTININFNKLYEQLKEEFELVVPELSKLE